MKLTVGIGLLGCGTVGAAVAERMRHAREAVERRTGIQYDLRAIAIRDTQKTRPGSLGAHLFTADAQAVVDDPDIDVLLECIGGTDSAADLVERALDRGRHVITANKDLIATQGPRLRALASSHGATLRFEAAVGGAIPIVRTLSEAMAGDEVTSISGIVSGTCTSILSAMEDGADYGEALSEAQRRGFAEADPSNDVDGVDAAHKLALLVQLAFGLAVISPRIRRKGIAEVTPRDIKRLRMLGHRIRLVAAAVRTAEGVMAEVGPVLLPEAHCFSQTSGSENVIRVVARNAGVLELRGAGAGGTATASAVVGDLVSVLGGIAERHDFVHRRGTDGLEPAIDVSPLFGAFPTAPDISKYPRWDDRELADAPTSQTATAIAVAG